MKSVKTHLSQYVAGSCIIILLVLFCTVTANAQPQMKYWYFNGEGVDFTTSTPSVFSTSASLSGAEGAANGIYYSSNDPLFHVIDNNLYDVNGDLIGALYEGSYSLDYMGPEIVILPVPGSCRKFYIIYVDIDSWSPESLLLYRSNLRYSEVDLGLNNGLGGFTPGKKNVLLTSLDWDAVGSIVVSQELDDGTRNLYFVGNDQINSQESGKVIKCVVDGNGVTYHSTLYSPASLKLATSEVELSEDGSMLAFALLDGPSATNVVLLHLDSDGDLNTNLGTNGVTTYDLPGGSGQAYTGIEFSPDESRLFVGASGVGMYYITLSSGSASFIASSDDLGDSQIELAYNGYMYAAESSSELIAIDWSQSPPALASSSNNVTFTGSPVIANAHTANTFNNPEIYTLPEQVDGQDYDDFEISPFDKTTYTTTTSGTNGSKQ